MRGELERLAYEAALRSLDKQEAMLEELRARTGMLLAASSLAVSFLGQRAFAHSSPRLLTLAALASFLVSVAACVLVLVPRHDLFFSMRGSDVEARLAEVSEDSAALRQRLANDFDSYWKANNARVRVLTQIYAVGACALVFEVLSMAILVAGILI